MQHTLLPGQAAAHVPLPRLHALAEPVSCAVHGRGTFHFGQQADGGAVVRDDALIGHTGFVGSTLRRQHGFSATFNSASIAKAAGQAFATAVCAAAPGSMFEANRLPERDALRIDALIASLEPIEAERFVLISTIAVLDRFDGGADEAATAFQQDLPYGRNRRRLETFCAQRFARCLIVRLPALYGPGLRKNFVFDLLNPVPAMLPAARVGDLVAALPPSLGGELAALYAPDPDLGLMVLDRAALDRSPARSALDAAVTSLGAAASGFTAPGSTFQYYAVDRLWQDIAVALAADLDVVHLAPEPLRAGAIYHALTGQPMPANAARVHHEDMRTRHAALFGGAPPYTASAEAALAGLVQFAAAHGPIAAGAQ